ncbi:MAG: hypothetical protein N2C14_28320, partial [Planctomycetales bacterium]
MRNPLPVIVLGVLAAVTTLYFGHYFLFRVEGQSTPATLAAEALGSGSEEDRVAAALGLSRVDKGDKSAGEAMRKVLKETNSNKVKA